jgi:[ribosomal protein S18]-alanine N-acetyltransferase
VIWQLQPVTGAGLAVLAEMHRRCFPDDPWNAGTLAEVLGLPGSFGWIACDGDDPVGFVLALAVASECEILSLGVLPQWRRAGTGLFLLDTVCAEARRRHAERIVLEVAVDNETARALYEKRGFVRVGRRPAYYRRAPAPVDALVLALSLSPPSAST